MILAGNDTKYLAAYPISDLDPETQLSTINWIAEKSVVFITKVDQEDCNLEVKKDGFAPIFKDWDFSWIIAPALIEGAETVLNTR